MSNSRKANFVIFLIVLSVIIVFAYSYNASVTTAVTDAMYNDREVLKSYNNEIIGKLVSTDSTDDWDNIVEQYQDVVIMIQDSSNNIITRSQGRSWSALDVRVRTAFEYHNRAYLIISSVYLLRDYNAGSRELVKFIFIEFLIGLSAFCLLVFVIYALMLRPYRKFYRLIEDYEKGGALTAHKFKGYIGKVYDRFVSLTRHLEIQQKNQQRIIASISHDIKTPLTSILGYAERLQKDNLPEDRKERYLETVYNKSLEIQSLIDEFDEYLSYNMLKAINEEPVTTVEIKGQLINDYATDLELLNITFEVNNNAVKDFVMIDKQKMNRVFGNIISNSTKHFSNRQGKIIVDINSDREKVYINISDNGTGVDEDKLEIIFEPLYTSDEGRKVAGLGLAICKEIIESHGGIIFARKSKMDGFEICIELKKGKNKLIHF